MTSFKAISIFSFLVPFLVFQKVSALESEQFDPVSMITSLLSSIVGGSTGSTSGSETGGATADAASAEAAAVALEDAADQNEAQLAAAAAGNEEQVANIEEQLAKAQEASANASSSAAAALADALLRNANTTAALAAATTSLQALANSFNATAKKEKTQATASSGGISLAISYPSMVAKSNAASSTKSPEEQQKETAAAIAASGSVTHDSAQIAKIDVKLLRVPLMYVKPHMLLAENERRQLIAESMEALDSDAASLYALEWMRGLGLTADERRSRLLQMIQNAQETLAIYQADLEMVQKRF